MTRPLTAALSPDRPIIVDESAHVAHVEELSRTAVAEDTARRVAVANRTEKLIAADLIVFGVQAGAAAAGPIVAGAPGSGFEAHRARLCGWVEGGTVSPDEFRRAVAGARP